MVITAISDTHSLHRKIDINSTDVLIHAGDWTGSSKYAYEQTEDLLEWLSEQRADHILLVAGNHDYLPATHPKEFQELLSKFPKVTYLQDEEIVIDNVKFYGTPWTPTFFDWHFMGTYYELRRHFKYIPDDTDVLISHGPPYGTLDLSLLERISIGSSALAQRVRNLALEAHIFGHIHGMHGQSGSSYNVSVLEENYKVAYAPTILEI